MTDHAVSIVIPTLNEADTIGLMLDDLDRARLPGDEILLIDGGSHDRTVELVTPRVDRVLESAPGRAVQMNAGAAVARCDFLWFVHADSRIAVGTREALSDGIAHGAAWGRFDVRLSGHGCALRLIGHMMNLRSCLTGIATGDQGIFVRRDLFEAIGGFPSIALMEDIALSRQLKRLARPRCVRRPRLLTSGRRWEQNGVWRTVLLMWRLRLAYWAGADPSVLARRYHR
ncbi:MAG: TIGR04283 family arsenosugar biosynthesis glycosyltransferase [Gammaproteobacteria bacterium]|nr:TIGR04283 family arsenosugar biosynthesis glycosyltransferase [Gammaproteobacteria bacterium]